MQINKNKGKIDFFFKKNAFRTVFLLPFFEK